MKLPPKVFQIVESVLVEHARLPETVATERANNVVQVLQFWEPPDPPIRNIIRDAALKARSACYGSCVVKREDANTAGAVGESLLITKGFMSYETSNSPRP